MVADWWNRHPEQWQAGELLLACGATAVADLRAAVAAELDYSCSAGIAHNKASYQIAVACFNRGKFSWKQGFSLWSLLWPEQYVRTEHLRIFANFNLHPLDSPVSYPASLQQGKQADAT